MSGRDESLLRSLCFKGKDVFFPLLVCILAINANLVNDTRKQIQDKIDQLIAENDKNLEKQQNLRAQIDALKNQQTQELSKCLSTAYKYDNVVVQNFYAYSDGFIKRFDISILNGSVNLRCDLSLSETPSVHILDSKYDGKVAIDSDNKELVVGGNVTIKDLVVHSNIGVLNLGKVYTQHCRILSDRIANCSKLKTVQNKDWQKQYNKNRASLSDAIDENEYEAAHSAIDFWELEGFYNAPGAKVVVKNGSVNAKDLEKVELGGTTNIDKLDSDGTVIIGYRRGTPEGKSYSCHINELIAKNVILEALKCDKNGKSLKGDNFDIKKINSKNPAVLMSNAFVTGKSKIIDIANKNGSEMSYYRLEGDNGFKSFIEKCIRGVLTAVISEKLNLCNFKNDQPGIDVKYIAFRYFGDRLVEFNVSIKDDNSKTEIEKVRLVIENDSDSEYAVYFYDQDGRRYREKEEAFLRNAFNDLIDKLFSSWSKDGLIKALMQTYVELIIQCIQNNQVILQDEYKAKISQMSADELEKGKDEVLKDLSLFGYPTKKLNKMTLEQILQINVDNKQYRNILEKDFLKKKGDILKMIEGEKMSELLQED